MAVRERCEVMGGEYFDLTGSTVHAIASMADRPELLAVARQIFDEAWSPTLRIPSVAIPDGLAPLRVDGERGDAVLIEPNVWMGYAIAQSA